PPSASTAGPLPVRALSHRGACTTRARLSRGRDRRQVGRLAGRPPNRHDTPRRMGQDEGADMNIGSGRTIVFFPEGAYGPTNNCVGIADVLRARGHRVVFVVEESFAGTLEAKGYEEARMRLGPPPAEPEVPGQFRKA